MRKQNDSRAATALVADKEELASLAASKCDVEARSRRRFRATSREDLERQRFIARVTFDRPFDRALDGRLHRNRTHWDRPQTLPPGLRAIER